MPRWSALPAAALRRFLQSLAPFVLLAGAGALSAQTEADVLSFFSHAVPLSASGSGSYSINGTLGGVDIEFLLDTGATMVTVSSAVFEQIQAQGSAVKVRRVGARLASGKVETLDVYRVNRLSLGDNCELGPVEVAVLKRGGRNLLGMNALQQAAPFAVSTSPPLLALSHCENPLQQVSLRD